MKTQTEKKVIAFDMDGTLLNDKKKISFLTRLYLKKLNIYYLLPLPTLDLEQKKLEVETEE